MVWSKDGKRQKCTYSCKVFVWNICRHGYMRIQINDQGKEFVNKVSENLHEMTGTEQRITSAYHPQSNDFKDSLVKVLEEKPKEWPNIMDGILFAHRVSIHYSTKYSPFFLMYKRHPILPIDLKYDLIVKILTKDLRATLINYHISSSTWTSSIDQRNY